MTSTSWSGIIDPSTHALNTAGCHRPCVGTSVYHCYVVRTGSVGAPPASSAGGRWRGKRRGPFGALVPAGKCLRPVSPSRVNGTEDFVLAVQPECTVEGLNEPCAFHSSGRPGCVARPGEGNHRPLNTAGRTSDRRPMTPAAQRQHRTCAFSPCPRSSPPSVGIVRVRDGFECQPIPGREACRERKKRQRTITSTSESTSQMSASLALTSSLTLPAVPNHTEGSSEMIYAFAPRPPVLPLIPPQTMTYPAFLTNLQEILL